MARSTPHTPRPRATPRAELRPAAPPANFFRARLTPSPLPPLPDRARAGATLLGVLAAHAGLQLPRHPHLLWQGPQPARPRRLSRELHRATREEVPRVIESVGRCAPPPLPPPPPRLPPPAPAPLRSPRRACFPASPRATRSKHAKHIQKVRQNKARLVTFFECPHEDCSRFNRFGPFPPPPPPPANDNSLL